MTKLLLNVFGLVILFIGILSIEVKSEQHDAGSGEQLKPKANKNPSMILSIQKGFPAPGSGDPRGLTWDGSYLWMAEDDTKGIYQIDTLNGSILDTIPTPGQSNTQGVTWDGSYLWHAEYDGNVYKIDPVSEEVVHTITAPTDKPTGLAWDGINLWVASYQDDQIYKFSPTDGALINSFASPTTNPWGLTWAGESLWNVQNSGGDIYELNPVDGGTKNIYPAIPGSNVLGMTSDGTHLWIVDNTKDSLFKMDVLAITTDIDYWSVNKVANKYQLDQNYPNPFNPKTIINYELPITNDVELVIYNQLGQKVITLISERQKAGSHQVEWDANQFSTGVYYYKIRAGIYQEVKKMILLR